MVILLTLLVCLIIALILSYYPTSGFMTRHDRMLYICLIETYLNGSISSICLKRQDFVHQFNWRLTSPCCYRCSLFWFLLFWTIIIKQSIIPCNDKCIR